jgi:hypothetical protein
MRFTARPLTRPATAVAAALSLAISVASLFAASPVMAYGGDGLRAAANAYRSSEGLAPVVGTALFDDIANHRAADMAAKNDLQHDIAYVKDRLDAASVCWNGIGEIIAYNWNDPYSSDATMLQWWNSPGHHAIIMTASYNVAGGAWERASDGRNYSVMVFAALCGSDLPGETSSLMPFTDVAGSPFIGDIAWLYENGLTSGCTATTFCPTAAVTRAQMATFLARVLDLPPADHDYYWDDAGSVHEASINALAAAGITRGCAPGRYCPSGTVTREQMASFLSRTLELTAGTDSNAFDDDNGRMFEADTNRVAYEGVTSGCGERRFCPTGVVTRGQMAAFLHRAFGS